MSFSKYYTSPVQAICHLGHYNQLTNLKIIFCYFGHQDFSNPYTTLETHIQRERRDGRKDNGLAHAATDGRIGQQLCSD